MLSSWAKGSRVGEEEGGAGGCTCHRHRKGSREVRRGCDAAISVSFFSFFSFFLPFSLPPLFFLPSFLAF